MNEVIKEHQQDHAPYDFELGERHFLRSVNAYDPAVAAYYWAKAREVPIRPLPEDYLLVGSPNEIKP